MSRMELDYYTDAELELTGGPPGIYVLEYEPRRGRMRPAG
jgi:hypothetical protein